MKKKFLSENLLLLENWFKNASAKEYKFKISNMMRFQQLSFWQEINNYFPTYLVLFDMQFEY